MDKLKPCPFCGGKAIIEKDVLGPNRLFIYRGECALCSSRTGDYTEYEEAIKAWNTRVEG